MGKTDKRQALKLRKRHPVVSIIMTILLLFLFLGFLTFLALQAYRYLIQSKTDRQVDKILLMSQIYDATDNKDAIIPTLGLFTDSFYIKDAGGKTIYSVGENTCNESEQSESSLYRSDEFDNMQLYFYDDTSMALLDVDEDYGFSIHVSEIDADTYGEIVSSDEQIVSAPFWMSLKTASGDTLYAKGKIDFSLRDTSMIIGIALLLALTVIIILIVMIVRIVNNIKDTRRARKLLFLDSVSNDNNWMKYAITTEEILSKRRNSINSYAVVNLVFVNYRNFVLCHSTDEGEKILRKVYQTIKDNVGKKDIVAHSTSSNFPLFIKCSEQEAVRMQLQSIISKLEKIDPDHKFSFHAGVSIIPASGKRRGVDIDAEYNNACTATATLEGTDDSGIAFFDDELLKKQIWIDQIREKQAQAIVNEEFVVYYQPKYNPQNNELSGAEALIRWQSPEFGFVFPGKFIPVFEKSGFITEIDHYMLDHVSRDVRKWLDLNMSPVPVSVNISRAHFIESDLPEQIRDIVDHNNCPHEYIEIELTESAFFDDKNALISAISRLQEYGFAVSMDDFGSGYSSLNSLKDLPLNVLKLDAGFFRGSDDAEREHIVVSEAIKLAKSLNMKTVAEGVEEKETVDFLAGEGCDMIQGYYYAKPMPGEDFEKRITNKVALIPEEDEEVSEETPASEPVPAATTEETTPEPFDESIKEDTKDDQTGL